MKFNIPINIEKKHAYFVVGILVLLSSLIFVVGTGYTSGAFHETLFTDSIKGKSGASVSVIDNVGIGTTPGGNEKLVVDFADGTWGLHFKRGATDLGGFHANGGIPTIKTGAANTLVIDGNVGIGTVSPSQKLDVAGTAKIDYLVIDPQNTAVEGGEMSLENTDPSKTFRIDNYDGNARIHTLGAGKVFQVLGGGISVPNGNVDVAGKVNAQEVCINGACKAAWPTSVESANTANSATTAATANNANNLGGLPASSYRKTSDPIGGLSGYEILSCTPTYVVASASYTFDKSYCYLDHSDAITSWFTIKCPSGKKIISGVCRSTPTGNIMPISIPVADGSGWLCSFPTTMYAICANA